jgi:hypothetical protein
MKELKLYRESNGQYSTSESMNHDASGVYVQKTDYDELRVEHYDERAKAQELLKENAELRAIIEAFASISIDIESSETSLTGNGVFVKNSTINEFESARYKLPAQHLADIKADAVDSVLKNCRIQSAFGSDIMGTIDVISVVEYASKLRGESK